MPCCAVRAELRGFALIVTAMVFSVAESGSGVRVGPRWPAGSLDAGLEKVPLLGSGPRPGLNQVLRRLVVPMVTGRFALGGVVKVI